MKRKHPNSIVRYCFGIIMISIFIFGNIACKEQPQNPPEKITIAYSMGIYHSFPYLVSAKGFFAAEGLNVTLQTYNSGKAALDSLLEGKADLALSSDTPFMFAIAGGNRISLIAVLASSGKNIAIAAGKDRGIVSSEDLRGRKIGVTRGTAAEFFMDLFLSVRGIGRNEIVIVDLKPDEIIDAMLDHKIDAAVIWHPFLMQLQHQLGDHGNIFYDHDIFKDQVCISTSREFIGNHPETLKKILKAFMAASRFVKQNPDEARKIISEFSKTDINVLKKIWNPYDFNLSLEQSLIAGLQDQTRWAIRNKLTERTDMPDYYDFIYSDALKSVKPEAVSVIR